MSDTFNICDGDPYFCVVGSPINHSKSPQIHAAFGRQCDVPLRYERVEIKAGSFQQALAEFVVAGGRGMNVTVPLKEEACLSASTLRSRAQATGAANMITVDADGTTVGDNSDGAGLIRDLLGNHRQQLINTRVLLIGAGGAARGVIPSLLAEQVAELVVVNRTALKARTLADQFSRLGSIRASDYDSLSGEPYDLVVNATSLSLSGQIPPLPRAVIGADTCCYDMMYTQDGKTPFLEWCRSTGARQAYDGLGMLVEQAANAFSLWHGVEPDTAAVIKMLR
jgi:shikimate dehydrogenase